MTLLLVLIRIVHIAAAILAGGAAFYYWFAVRPALGGLDEGTRAATRDAMLRRWFPVITAVVALLLVTGLANYLMFKIPAYRDHPQKGVYHGLLGVKMLLALAVFHAATVLALPGPRGERWRSSAFWRIWPVVGVLMIVILGAVLVNFNVLFPPVVLTPADTAHG